MTTAPPITRHPWDRQEGEPDKAFRAFRCYLELGPGGRSLYDVTVAFYGDDARNAQRKPSRTVEQWSSTWSWRDRCEAWDAAVSAQATERVEEAFAAELDVWVERERQMREALWERAQKLLEKADAMLEAELATSNWTWNTVPRLVDAAARMMELSIAMRPAGGEGNSADADRLAELGKKDAAVNRKMTELLAAVRKRTLADG